MRLKRAHIHFHNVRAPCTDGDHASAFTRKTSRGGVPVHGIETMNQLLGDQKVERPVHRHGGREVVSFPHPLHQSVCRKKTLVLQKDLQHFGAQRCEPGSALRTTRPGDCQPRVHLGGRTCAELPATLLCHPFHTSGDPR